MENSSCGQQKYALVIAGNVGAEIQIHTGNGKLEQQYALDVSDNVEEKGYNMSFMHVLVTREII